MHLFVKLPSCAWSTFSVAFFLSCMSPGNVYTLCVFGFTQRRKIVCVCVCVKTDLLRVFLPGLYSRGLLLFAIQHSLLQRLLS